MNLYDYQIKLLRSHLYAASPFFLKYVGWRAEQSSHVLIDKESNGNADVCIVARVSDQRFNVGAKGNYVDGKYGPFSKAKFELQLAKPYGTPFASDFDNVLLQLGRAQAQIAETKQHRNLIVSEKLNKNLRFTRPIFVKREQEIPRPSTSDPTNEQDDSTVGETVGEETEAWPVPSHTRSALDDIKYAFRASPLRVYVEGQFVEPGNVEDALRGALVEIRFDLRHFCIKQKNEDSFNASIQQIKVIAPGDPRPTSNFKLRGPREGPIDLDCPPLKRQRVSDPASHADQGNVGQAVIEQSLAAAATISAPISAISAVVSEAAAAQGSSVIADPVATERSQTNDCTGEFSIVGDDNGNAKRVDTIRRSTARVPSVKGKEKA